MGDRVDAMYTLSGIQVDNEGVEIGIGRAMNGLELVNSDKLKDVYTTGARSSAKRI